MGITLKCRVPVMPTSGRIIAFGRLGIPNIARCEGHTTPWSWETHFVNIGVMWICV